MKKITKILSLVVSTILVAVMMTACGEVKEGAVIPAATVMQEKLSNEGYTAVAEYDMNSRVSIVTAKVDLSFKYDGDEKVFFTDWVSADWYPSEEDAELGFIEAEKVKGNLILKRDGDVVYLGTENGVNVFEHKTPKTIDEGKQVMQTASYQVNELKLYSYESDAKASKKFEATLGDESVTVLYFDDTYYASDFYAKRSAKGYIVMDSVTNTEVARGSIAEIGSILGLKQDDYSTTSSATGRVQYKIEKLKAYLVANSVTDASTSTTYSANTLVVSEEQIIRPVLQKEGNLVFYGTENAVATYKGTQNINSVVDGYSAKLEALGYTSNAYKKGMAGAVKAKKGDGEWDIQVAWFTNESIANDAKNYLEDKHKKKINDGKIKVVLEGNVLILGTEQAIADFNS